MSKSLWPDFDIGQVPRSPKAIIEEAGGGLAKRGLVESRTGETSINDHLVEVPFFLYIEDLSYYFPFMRLNLQSILIIQSQSSPIR
jgi:hypothetical protein